MRIANRDPFSDEAQDTGPCSLYPLAMEGDPNAPEGLLSWLVGLSQAHCLGPRDLVRHLMKSHAKAREIWAGSTFFESDCATVNGLGNYAQLIAELLNAVGEQDFSDMTLLPLSQLLPKNGEGLLAKRPRWCQHCLCEQVRAGRRPHFPLVWSMDYYRACHIHGQLLCQHCPSCGKQSWNLPNYPSLVHCPECREPILRSVQRDTGMTNVHGTEFEIWCSTALVDLVARRRLLQESGTLDHFRCNLAQIIERFSPGNRKRLCEQLGLQIYALNGWINKDERPSMAVLLRFAFGVGIMPADLFLPNAISKTSRSAPVEAPASEREDRPLLGYVQRERITKLLELILLDPTDHRGLSDIGKQIGLTRHALKYWFKEQSQRIVRKRRICDARKLKSRYSADHAVLRTVVQGYLVDGIYPSRRKVQSSLEHRGLSLTRPDLLYAYQEMRALAS